MTDTDYLLLVNYLLCAKITTFQLTKRDPDGTRKEAEGRWQSFREKMVECRKITAIKLSSRLPRALQQAFYDLGAALDLNFANAADLVPKSVETFRGSLALEVRNFEKDIWQASCKLDNTEGTTLIAKDESFYLRLPSVTGDHIFRPFLFLLNECLTKVLGFKPSDPYKDGDKTVPLVWFELLFSDGFSEDKLSVEEATQAETAEVKKERERIFTHLFPKAIHSYLETVARGFTILPIPLFLNISPKDSNEILGEISPEYMVGVVDCPNDIIHHRALHLVSFWESWDKSSRGNSKVGFPTACIRDFLIQKVRNALGFEGTTYNRIASKRYFELRQRSPRFSPEEIEKARAQSGNNERATEKLVELLNPANETIEYLLGLIKNQLMFYLDCYEEKYKNFCFQPSVEIYKKSLKVIYADLEGLKRELVEIQSSESLSGACNTYATKYYEYFSHVLVFEESIPVPVGAGLINQHLGRPPILVIDDDAEEECKRLGVTPLIPDLPGSDRHPNPVRLDEIFEFQALNVDKLSIDNCDELILYVQKYFLGETVPEKSRETDINCKPEFIKDHFPQRMFAILLDVSFEKVSHRQGVAEEIIRTLRRFAPGAHILINTHFGQDRYMVRAMTNGADWYCRKEQPHRLLRVLNNLELNRHEVQPSPSAISLDESAIIKALEACGAKSVRDRKKELAPLFERLLADLPGRGLEIHALTGGLSRAVTVKVYRRCYDRDAEGRSQGRGLLPIHEGPAPLIVKIDRSHPLLGEQRRYQLFIRPFIDNNVGRVDRPMQRVDWRTAMIAYSHTGERQGATGLYSGTETKTLGAVLGANVNARDVRPFEDYQIVFDNLFNEILPRIHRIRDTTHEEVYPDFPNHFYDEFESPAQHYEIRLPTELTVDISFLKEITPELDIEKDFRNIVHLREMKKGGEVKVENCPVFVIRGISGGSIYVLPLLHAVRSAEKPATYPQIRLTGEYANFLINRKAMRPGQVVQAAGFVTETRETFWDNCRQNLRIGLVRGDDPLAPDSINLSMSSLSPMHTQVRHPHRGIIHGDLNLENILVECHTSGRPSDGKQETSGRSAEGKQETPLSIASTQPWLIDFARTRRDSIAFDFAEFESVLGAALLNSEWLDQERNESYAEKNLCRFFEALNKLSWETPEFVYRDRRLRFVYDALRYVRRAVARTGIDRTEYLAHLHLSNLVTVKVFGLTKGREGSPNRNAARVAGAAAKVALKFLKEG